MGATAAVDDPWYDELNRVLTSITRQAHSVRLFEEMGRQAGVDIRPYLFGVLSRIRDLQPVRVSDVAKDMDCDSSTVSRHVAELTSLGCLERSADPTDGRVVILRLSREGTAAIDRVFDAWLTLLGDIVSDWSQEDKWHFLAHLSRFDRQLGQHFDALVAPPGQRAPG